MNFFLLCEAVVYLVKHKLFALFFYNVCMEYPAKLFLYDCFNVLNFCFSSYLKVKLISNLFYINNHQKCL